jgi:excisionase family DNA binding protein
MSAELNGHEGHDLKWAARRLGVSVFTVRLLCRRRELGHVRLGRRIVLYEQDCADYLDRHRVEARQKVAGR